MVRLHLYERAEEKLSKKENTHVRFGLYRYKKKETRKRALSKTILGKIGCNNVIQKKKIEDGWGIIQQSPFYLNIIEKLKQNKRSQFATTKR